LENILSNGAEHRAAQNADETEGGIFLSANEAKNYLELSRKYGVLVGIGVWLILAGVCAMILTQNAAGVFGDMTGAAGVFFLLLTVAAAVPIFIVNGMRMEPYERYDHKNILLEEKTRAEIEELRADLMPRVALRTGVGASTIIIAVGVFIFAASLGHAHPAVAFLVLVIGLAVFLFITADADKTAFDVLLNQGDYANKGGGKKSDRIIAIVSSVYWPLATAAFLLWGFLGGWGSSWIIWPIAGVAYGAFCGVVSLWHGGQKTAAAKA